MKNFSHNDAFGWVFFILTLATFNVGVYERSVQSNGSYVTSGKVDFYTDRSAPESSALHVVLHEAAFVTETLSDTLENFRTTGRRAVSTTSGRTTRSTNSNSSKGGSGSFQTASNRFVFDRGGFNAFLFHSPQSSLIETRPLFLILLTLLN